MSSLSIPTRLFHGEAKRSALGLQAKYVLGLQLLCENKSRTDFTLHSSTEDPKLRFKPPPPFVDLSPSSLPAQIGLLRPFYQARLQTDHRLVDDEQSTLKVKVFRPKVPPSGKIPIKRKAGADDVANAGGSGASLKKKVKVDPGGNGASPAKAGNGNGTIPKSESGNKGESVGDVDQSADFATVTVTGAEVENS
jgi:transcriptional activator SPT7